VYWVLIGNDPNGTFTPNRVMELVRDETLFRKLLLYNGIDSLVTYRLAMLQMKELGLVS